MRKDDDYERNIKISKEGIFSLEKNIVCGFLGGDSTLFLARDSRNMAASAICGCAMRGFMRKWAGHLEL